MSSSRSKSRPRPSEPDCHESDPAHPNHSEFLPRLKRVEGQLAGIQRMIQEERYCVDILIQFRAVMAALRSIEVSIFERHLEHCLHTALLSKDRRRIDQKIQELTELLTRRSSL